MKQRHTGSCPLSYKRSNNDNKQTSKLLKYIFPGYETCNPAELFDASTQTDFPISDWKEQFEGRIQGVASLTSIHKSLDFEEYTDVIESENEEFLSAGEEREEEIYPEMPHYINIQLKDTPHIVMANGLKKTEISLTPEYLKQNGLELVIGEGPKRNIKLKAGEKEIYPSDKEVLSPDINISVTDDEEQNDNQKSKSGNEPDFDVTPDVNFQTSKLRIGLFSLAADEIEQRYYSELLEKNNHTEYPGYKVIRCISDEEYLKLSPGTENYEKKKEKLFKRLPEHCDNNNESTSKTLKDGKEGNYNQVKNNFFWTAFEGDPAIDLIKQGVIDELAKHDFQFPPREPSKKSIEIQTEVHINPNTTSEDFTYTPDSDSLYKRFFELRGPNSGDTNSHDEQAPFQTNHRPNEKKYSKTNTNEATIGQMESDFSTKTEPTLEGILELTETNDATTINDDLLSEKEGGVTDEDVSEISDKKFEIAPLASDIKKMSKRTLSEKEGDTIKEDLSEISNQKVHNVTYIEKVSKATETCDLGDASTSTPVKDESVLSARTITSPSFIKALKSFEEALDPLKAELSRLHSEFKSIDIPEEFRLAMTEQAPEPPPLQPQRDSYPKPPASYGSSYGPFQEIYRNSNPPPSGQHRAPLTRCSCPPGTCLGFLRSSGVECQRIRRLPPQASSLEFLREFTRPNWDRNSAYRADSIWSEPEDILGSTSQQPSTSRNNVKNNNKTEKF